MAKLVFCKLWPLEKRVHTSRTNSVDLSNTLPKSSMTLSIRFCLVNNF